MRFLKKMVSKKNYRFKTDIVSEDREVIINKNNILYCPSSFSGQSQRMIPRI